MKQAQLALPATISRYVQSLCLSLLVPIYLRIDANGRLIDYNGELSQCGLIDLAKNSDIITQLPFLDGLLHLSSPEVLEFINLNDDCVVHIHIVPNDGETWILFLDGLIEHQRQQKIQQQYNDLSLTHYRQSQLIKVIQHQAHYDILTDLPNRQLFNDRLKQALKQAQRDKRGLGLMFIDLDGFKGVNDNFGHAIGDKLLCQVGDKLKHSIRAVDSVARIGGDEFTVILPQIDDISGLKVVANKILRALNLRLEQQQIFASIGIAYYPAHGENIDVLLKNADNAMYLAKKAGGNRFVIYAA